MKVSEKWLRTWVDPPISTEQLADQLTNLGLEVEDCLETAPTIDNVVVAEVKAVRVLKDDERLTVCTLDDGTGAETQVVCGAPNVRVGMRSAFARVGASLPSNVAVEARSVRGEQSLGMLCSAGELDLGSDNARILDLPDMCALGDDIVSAVELEDTTIDIDLTPNRGDCLSIRGIAREAALVNKLDFCEPAIAPVESTISDRLEIELADPLSCPRYLGRCIKGIDGSRASPQWLTNRLIGCGLRPINAVVDITNYVMLELGQPLHAFDQRELHGRVIVRKAEANESLTLLDGTEINCNEETLLITDEAGPLAIAGVMGGEKSGIHNDTQDVFLECAYFAPRSIQQTARAFALQTDASSRYERGVDPELQHRAIERATALLLDIVGGEAGPITVAESEHLPSSSRISLTQVRLHALVGEEFKAENVTDIFERLGLKPKFDDGVWHVTVPSHRFDLAIEEDLVEEICRVHGFDNIASRVPPSAIPLRQVSTGRREIKDAKSRLAELGYLEAITYSFVNKDLNARFAEGVNATELQNPMSEERSTMRASLLPGLIESVQYNFARQQTRLRLFEHGQIFKTVGSKLQQTDLIGGVATGSRLPELWAHNRDPVDFFDVKGDVESLLTLTGADYRYGSSSRAFLHPGQSSEVMQANRSIGFLGRLHPSVEQSCELDQPVFVWELDAGVLMERERRSIESPPHLPSVRRDLALLVSKEVAVTDIEAVVTTNAGELLDEVRVFDVYEGHGIDENKKSVAIGITLQPVDQTLTDEEVNGLIERVVAALKGQLSATLR